MSHDIDPRDAIDAFADGEAVEADVLLQALASADERQYFVDLLMLRRAVRGPVGVAAGGTTLSSRPARPRGTRSAKWWTLAAAAVLTAAVSGFAGGVHVTRAADATREAAAFLTTSAPAPAASSVTTPVLVESTARVPPPTEIIRLERGVDWAERFGGD